MIAKNLRLVLEHPISNGAVKAFRTRKLAETSGKKYGWNTAMRLDRRFEKVWIVCSKDFQPTNIAGIPHDQYRIPMLRWERDARGIEYCPVLKIEIAQR